MSKQPLHPYTAIINRKQKLHSKYARNKALNWLASIFPEAFNTEKRIRPLKIGIMHDIIAHAESAANNGLSKSKLREALIVFTRRIDYLACLKAQEIRIDLSGNPTTQVTAEEAEKAAIKLKKRIDKSIRNTKKIIQTSAAVPTAKPSTPTYNQHPTFTEYRKPAMEPLSAYSGQTAITQNSRTAPPIVIKKKTTRAYDADSVARLKAKLGITTSEVK